MPRPLKTDLRDAISRSRTELSLAHPMMPASKMDQLTATAHGVSLSTVRYYLRTASPVDRRMRYSPEERRKIAGMTRSELFVYAARTGRNFNTLYSMIHRLKHSKLTEVLVEEQQRDTCEERNYIDFGRLADLRAFSFPLGAFKEARKAIRGIHDLDLRPPNYLVHKPTKKFYILTLSDQKFLLTNPRRFIHERAAHISAHWKDGSQDPHKSHFLLVDTTEHPAEMLGICLSAHPDFESALEAKRELGDETILIAQRGGAWDAPSMHFAKGERVPQFSLDAIATVLSRGNVHTISQVNMPRR